MRRRDFLGGGCAAAACALNPRAVYGLGNLLHQRPVRGCRICVDSHAAAELQVAARTLSEAAQSHVLLNVLADGRTPEVVDSRALLQGPPTERAYSHLVMVGLPSDPLIDAAWQREAKLTSAGMYIFGFGHLAGDIGYVESDRNPFLHAAAIPTAPFETVTITLTGTNIAGVKLAVRSFLEASLVNGVVAGGGWLRPQGSLLERDPLAIGFSVPEIAPKRIGRFSRIALTQAGEDEYRGVLADTGSEPEEIWRFKYYEPGAWDAAGSAGAFADYAAGLHRRAYGSTLWAARFTTAKSASEAAPRIAVAAQLAHEGTQWIGKQPPYATGTYPGEKPSAGSLSLWQQDRWVLMNTLPRS